MGDKGPVKEDHWWERVFNEASNNVNVQQSANGEIAVDLIDKDGVEITNKSFSLKKLKNSNTSLQYGNFLKSATLLANVGKEEEIEGHLSTNDIEIKPITVLSDEDLFKACNGRTGHKGARHGLNLSGKLQRIAEQEKMLLERMKNKTDKSAVFREPPVKKVKKNPLADLNSSKDDTSDDNRLPIDTETDYVLKASKKRKREDKKQEHQLVKKINGIGLSEEKTEVVEISKRVDTPVRKKKKPKRTAGNLLSLQEVDQPSQDVDSQKKKKKKRKRGLDEDDDMPADKYLKPNSINKAKKVKLNDSYEVSEDEEDIVDKINAEQEAHRLDKKKKKKRRSKGTKQRKQRDCIKNTADCIARLL